MRRLLTCSLLAALFIGLAPEGANARGRKKSKKSKKMQSDGRGGKRAFVSPESLKMFLAVEDGDVAACAALLLAPVPAEKHKVDMDAQSESRSGCPRKLCSAIHVCAANSNVEMCALLLKHGASPNNQDSAGRGALHIAAEKNDVPMVTQLLQAGADASLRNKAGTNPLHVAITNSAADAARAILEHGKVDVNAVTSSGGTALHLAGFWGLLDVAAMLLEQNADPAIKDTKGRTAWQKADDKEAFKAVLDRATKQEL